MKKLSLFFISILFLSSILFFSGCSLAGTSPEDSSQDSSSKDENEPAEITDEHSNDGENIVGISMPSHVLERWTRDGEFLKNSFEKAGYKVIIRYADDLIDSQIDDIDYMIKKKADVMLITPIDSSSLAAVLDRAAQANITVIAYDRLLMDSANVSYYVSFDNYRVGQLQGEFIRDRLRLDEMKRGEHKNIEIISGDPVDNNARYFYSGAYDVLSPYLDSSILTVPSGMKTYYETAISSWSTTLANERFISILNSYYTNDTKLDAVLCANDSTASGVVQAIGSQYPSPKKVVITGQDADVPNLKYIEEGRQTMTVYKALPNEAVVALALTEAVIEGAEPDDSWIESQKFGFDVRLDTKQYDNGEKKVPSLLLAPVMITKDNIDKELIKPGYYKRTKDGEFKALK